ncbi:MAG: alpha/beta hydrolase [Caldilineaceae bacterium]
MPATTVNNVTLNYREVGDRDKPPVLLAHTVLWGAEVFAPLIAALAPDFYIIDTDLHGHGESSYRTPLTIAEMAADYQQLLTQLGLSQVTWIGYSLGSMIGLHLAIQQPTLFDRLVLMATNARSDASPLSAQTRQLWDLFRAGHREDVVDAAMPLFFGKATWQQQPHLVAQYRQRAINMQEVEGIYQAALASAAPRDLMDQLGAICAKSLIIAGREDMTATPAEAEAIAANIPGAQLAIVEESSHLLLVEKPQEVVQIIHDFLRQ